MSFNVTAFFYTLFLLVMVVALVGSLTVFVLHEWLPARITSIIVAILIVATIVAVSVSA